MSYSKNVQRILGGGIDYRVRPTELPDAAAQKMTNCSLDQNRSIRSRKGHKLLCNASGKVLQMIRGLGARWAATTAAVDKDCTALIAVPSAYIVSFKKFIWAGNGQMRKSDGTHDWRWIPKAPTDPPEIATAAEVITLVDDFTEGWVEDIGVDSDTEGEEPPAEPAEVAFDDNGLKVKGADATVKSYTKAKTLNLYDGFDKDDLFRIRLRAKVWSKIAGVSFEVDVNTGDFKTDFYKARMPLKEIIGGKKETMTFYLRKRPLEPDEAADNKNQWGFFERIGQTTDKDWRSVVALRVKVEFTEATRFWFSNWEMVGNEDNTLEGDDFGVYYTYTTKAGHESNPSPKSKLITVNHGSINVTKLVASTDEQVIGCNVYLTGGTLGAVYRVNGAGKFAAKPTTDDSDVVPFGDYTITQSANDLTDFNIQLEDDHDDPPEADGIAGPYFGRILAWKGSRLYWTHQNKPYAFSNPDGPDGDWTDLGEDGGKIMHISIRPDQAWIYTEHDMFLLVGDPGADNGSSIHSTGLRMGTPARNGVAQAGPADIAYLGTGVYITDTSGTARKISEELEPIFKGIATDLWDGSQVQPINDPTSIALGYEDGIVRFSHSEFTFVHSITLSRWVGDTRVFTAYQPEGEAGMLAGKANGEIVHLEDGFTDNGVAITIDFLSKAYDCGYHDSEKRAEDVTTYFDAAGNPLTETVYYTDNGLGIPTTLTGFGRDRYVLQLNGGQGIRARAFAVRITGATVFEAFIEAIDLNYYIEAREAKSYDTAVTDAGTHHVKLIRELQVDLENVSAVTCTLETDLPHFGLSAKETHAIGVNVFRRTEPVVMTDEIYGHDFRIVLSGAAGMFHCFGARALVQSIGTYLHGQKDEYYLSDPVDWGSERVKLAREIEIVYRTVGSATVTLYADIPTGVFAAADNSVATFTLTQSLLERTAKLRLTGLIKARLFQLRVAPTANDFRLEAARIRLKAIGEPSATPWTWTDFPVAATQDAIWTDLSFQQDAPG